MKQLHETQILSEDEARFLREIKEIIVRALPDAELYLYGSAARGERKPDSDYDVLVLVGERVPGGIETNVTDAVLDLELERHVLVSITFVTREEWGLPAFRGSPFYKNVLRDGVVV